MYIYRTKIDDLRTRRSKVGYGRPFETLEEAVRILKVGATVLSGETGYQLLGWEKDCLSYRDLEEGLDVHISIEVVGG